MVLYTQKSLEELRKKVNLHEIISPHIELKKEEDFYFGKCPFHQNNEETFKVIPKSNMYYCQECNAKGDTISFLMIYQKMSFQQAVEFLFLVYEVQSEEILSNKNLENK